MPPADSRERQANFSRVDMILIVQVSCDRGYGAERMLECLLGGIPPGSRGQLALLTPPEAPLAAAAAELGIRVFPLPITRMSILQTVPAALGLAYGRGANRLTGVSRVHAWTLRAFDPALIIARRLHVPCMATLHDHPQAGFLSPARRLLARRQARSLDGLVCVSDALRQAVTDCWGRRVQARTIHNGIPDIEVLPPPGGQCRRIGFIGMHAFRKGFDVVADAVSLCPDNLEWRFYGEPHPAYASRVAALRQTAGPRVQFPGWCRTDTIFEEVDLLVHAATEFDPYPTVLLEAARSGRPVVASPAGGAVEIVSEGQTGYVVAPESRAIAERVSALAADPGCYHALSLRARDHYRQHFMVDAMAESYLKLWGIHGDDTAGPKFPPSN